MGIYCGPTDLALRSAKPQRFETDQWLPPPPASGSRTPREHGLVNEQILISPPPLKAPHPAAVKPIAHSNHRRAPRRWVVVGLLAVAAAAIGVAWWSKRSTATVHYVTVPASRGAIVRTVTSTGIVNPEL